MPLNAKQSTRENKIGIAFKSVCPFGPSTPARPSPRVFAVRASQLVVHQLETFLAEAPVGNWCLQTDRLDLRPPMALHSRHLSLQPLPTRGGTGRHECGAKTTTRKREPRMPPHCANNTTTRAENATGIEVDGHWQLSWRGGRPAI